MHAVRRMNSERGQRRVAELLNEEEVFPQLPSFADDEVPPQLQDTYTPHILGSGEISV